MLELAHPLWRPKIVMMENTRNFGVDNPDTSHEQHVYRVAKLACFDCNTIHETLKVNKDPPQIPLYRMVAMEEV